MFPNNFYNSDYYGALGGASEDPQSNQNSQQYGVSGTGMGAYSAGFPSHQQPQGGGAFSSSARGIYDALPESPYTYDFLGVRSPEVTHEALVRSPQSFDLNSVWQGETLSSAEGLSLTLSSPSPALVSQSMRGSGQVATPPFTEAQFLRAIRVSAQGATWEQAAEHAVIDPDLFRNYLGSNNKLTEQGKAYVASLSQSVQQNIHQELGSSSYGDSQSWVGGAEQAESSQGVTLTETAFMNVLPHYASGKRLNECGMLSGVRGISSYFGNLGVQRDGLSIYNNLPQPMKDRVDAAIAARRHALFGVSGLSSGQEGFLRALEPFALGVGLRDCESQANWMGLRNCVSTKGVLTDRGIKLVGTLPRDSLPEVNAALTARQTWYVRSKLMTHHFLTAMELFASTTWSVDEIASQVGGLERGLLGLVLCDAGLTDVGRGYVSEMLSPDQIGLVDQYIARRRQG